MFTAQQRVTRSPLSMTPRTDVQKIGNTTRHVSGKGKAVAFIAGSRPPPPPLGSLNENGVNAAAESGDLNDWRRFKEAGLLDEAAMGRKDREALLEKTARLEKELFDYQFNMGLLLIENKELTANTEDLREALAETQEVVKREEAAHLMAVSEVERRAENLKKALDSEKHCRVDLEKALREIDEENKQIKLRSQINFADANTLVAGLGDKSREVEEKMHEADARLAEANRQSLELDRRMQELETHESVLRSERQSVVAGREAWEDTFSKHEEHLHEWERKLQEGEERVRAGRKTINLREENVNEIERSLKQKEKELEAAHNKIDLSVLASKKKEDDVNNRLLNLIVKEEQAELIKKNLEMKGKELLDLTEKLTAKETVEIQKLLDAHKDALDSNRHEFDLEIEEKRKSFEDDMRSMVEDVEQKEAEINHKEEKSRTLEQALEKKSERLKENEKDLDTKLNALKEKENSNTAEAKMLEMDKKQVLADKENLEILKVNTEKIRADITQKELEVHEEIKRLRITEDERTTYARLQLELKEEIEKCRLQKELIMKELEDLRKDRMKFEEDWEALDEKRSAVAKELNELSEQKENWEKLRHSEEQKFEKDKLASKDYIRRELEAVDLERETFAATMKHEQSLLFEKADNERRQFLHEFELTKRDLEVGLQNTQAEMERKLQGREKAFEEEREKELSNISYLKEVIRKAMEEVRSERCRVDREKEEIAVNTQRLEENRLEMQKDIDELGVLSKTIKDQRVEFVEERNRFLAFVERLKNCGHCGQITRSYEISDLPRTLNEIIERSEGILAVSHEINELSPAANKLTSPGTGGLVSWLRNSAAAFKLSPHQKMDRGQGEVPETPLPDNVSGDSKIHEAPEGSQQSDMRSGRQKPVRKPKGGARRNHTVEDAQIELENTSKGRSSKDKHDGSVYVNDERPRDRSYDEKRAGPTTRKRSHGQTSLISGSEMDAADSEACSESVTTGGRRKRRQTVAPAVQTPGKKRYNLRRHKTGDIAPQTRASADCREKMEVYGTSGADNVKQSPETASALSTGVASDDGNTSMVHAATSKRADVHALDTAFRTSVDVVGSSDAAKLVENAEIVEEINGSHECNVLDERKNVYNGNDNDDDDDDDDGDDGLERHPGEMSIGKKIRSFLST